MTLLLRLHLHGSFRLWNVKGEGGTKKWPKLILCGKNIEKTREPQNGQNSIWSKTGHHKICREAPPAQNEPQTLCVGYKRARQTEKRTTREASRAEVQIRRRRRVYGSGCCCCGSSFGSGSLLERGSWAARNLQNTGFQDQRARLCEFCGQSKFCPGVKLGMPACSKNGRGPVHQSARTACLTIVGMTASVLGVTRCPVVSGFILQCVNPPCNKSAHSSTCSFGGLLCVTHTPTCIEKFMVLWNCFKRLLWQ